MDKDARYMFRRGRKHEARQKKMFAEMKERVRCDIRGGVKQRSNVLNMILDPSEDLTYRKFIRAALSDSITFYEAMLRDGIFYERDDQFRGVDGFRTYFFMSTQEMRLAAPEVICPCGCDRFTLRYGGYRLEATCAECGNTDVVYSG